MSQYIRAECACFRKTKELYGGLSNMAAGYPLIVSGIEIRTSEALYQSQRFPHLPGVQRDIIAAQSPFWTKKIAYQHLHLTQPDWDVIRVPLMLWCLRVKTVQNWEKFGALLESTGDRQIVEESSREGDFWSAVPRAGGVLEGENTLGKLLVDLRAEKRMRTLAQMQASLSWPGVSGLLLYGKPIEVQEGQQLR